MKVINLNVRPQEWVPQTDVNGKNLRYYRTFAMPEITPSFYDQGMVQVYVYNNGGQQILPYVQPYENLAGAQWTRTINYDYAAGDLTVYVTSSDFYNEIPEEMNFRVVLLW